MLVNVPCPDCGRMAESGERTVTVEVYTARGMERRWHHVGCEPEPPCIVCGEPGCEGQCVDDGEE